jgi:hypothetical protein
MAEIKLEKNTTTGIVLQLKFYSHGMEGLFGC